ncbi:MAG TPA: ATP-binding protein [Elusimicrobiales bacterium]|nr:ATP-binding protein [Elusimicrobiales bacterium]HOL62015.1 ATP-binding protein [Elusimicrobiales bacterium]HPO95119.1 ATP-binding protein [Elusimicrobiales bacterium]
MSEIDKLEMLVTVSRLLSSKLDIADLLTTIMRLATRVVNSERASLYLLDEKTQELYFDVALDLDEELKKMRFKLGEGLAGTVAKEARSVISNNVDKDPSHTKKVDEKSGYITRSLLTCPMIIKGKVIGVVQAINKVEGDFTEEDKNNFEAFASQAAIAIENSRLFNKVKDEKNKLENIFKVIEEGVVVTDEEGNIKIINDSGVKYFDYNSNKHITITDILEGFLVDTEIEELLKEKKNYKFLAEKKDNKKLILECDFVADKFSFKEGKEFLWIFNDVTQKITESRVSREFLSLVSHKFKTPITSMVGYSQILEQMECDNEIIKKAIKSIISQGFKLSSLVDEMLEFSSIENKSACELKLTDIKSSDIIDSVISQKKEKYKEVEFEKAIIDNFELKIDSELFYKALSELIRNGIKHNKKDKKKIIITSKIFNGFKTISVWDNGNGIPGRELDKIFDKFYQIESGFTGQTEGWGLGLSMVKKILELHGFSYKIKSQVDKDTIFTIIMDKI